MVFRLHVPWMHSLRRKIRLIMHDSLRWGSKNLHLPLNLFMIPQRCSSRIPVAIKTKGMLETNSLFSTLE